MAEELRANQIPGTPLTNFKERHPRCVVYKGIAVITQLYYQVYVTYQLHVSANAAVAIIRLDTIYQRSLTICTNAHRLCVNEISSPYLH